MDPASVVVYDRSWPVLFRSIGERLRRELGELALRIDHIGSTAVPGLDAKPTSVSDRTRFRCRLRTKSPRRSTRDKNVTIVPSAPPA